MNDPAIWYFDPISPYAYLALARLPEIETKMPVVLKPVVFGALLKHWGHLGPAEIAPKRVHIYRQVMFMAAEMGLPLRLPPQHPFNPLPILRLLTVLDGEPAAVARAFHLIWGEGRDPTTPEVLADVAATVGDAAAVDRINDQPSKDRLTWATMQATDAGVFGVPTLRIGRELFWGLDAIDMALAFIDDPALFTRGDYARIDGLPVGIRRVIPPRG